MMTLSLAAAANGRGAQSRRRGFTLIELLVVIGIILILMGLLLPMLARSYRSARKARMQSDLGVIASALDAYRADFKDYPRTDPADTVWGTGGTYPNGKGTIRGACTLCWALLAPGSATGTAGSDGADGNGFRIRTSSGRIYGPYISPDHFTIGFLNGGTAGDNHYYFIADTNGYPYLYFPANEGVTITAANGYVGTTSQNPMYNLDDNDIYDPIPGFTSGFFIRSSDGGSTTLATERFEVMIGASTNGSASGTSADGAPVAPKATGLPYLLWGLGPDDQGGPDNPTNSQSISLCDDVFNFQ
ncbi:MAG TPA: type II secretion system protein [Tepidisphaeraceae bacterium]|jgi:prepilin-type N-terminal cleavage/methylation domain-containing protein|nr:type II secretion system protein [Tepidisphaeraceae bacterium]